MSEPLIHIPVLLEPVLEHLDIQPDDIVLDGNIGYGGHAEAIIKHLGPNGKYIGLDQDHNAINFCKARFEGDERVVIIHSNFNDFASALHSAGISKVTKVE